MNEITERLRVVGEGTRLACTACGNEAATLATIGPPGIVNACLCLDCAELATDMIRQHRQKRTPEQVEWDRRNWDRIAWGLPPDSPYPEGRK